MISPVTLPHRLRRAPGDDPLFREGLLVQSCATAESTLAQYRAGMVTFASVLQANAGYINAVIDSGTEKVVFVALGEGRFEPRRVQLGESDGKSVEVTSGLAPGEQVVTRANFLIDSESRLRASLAALSSPAQPTPASAGREEAAPEPEPPAKNGGGGQDPHAGHGR